MKDQPGSLAVTNTKLAACFAALGFNYSVTSVQPENGGPLRVQFLFSGRSSRPEFAQTVMIGHGRAFLDGKLEKIQPMHPLCVMMRGQNNYDRLTDAGRGAAIRLVGVAGGCMTSYQHGPLDQDFLVDDLATVPVDDLALAAALGGVGLPLVALEGPQGSHRYHIARFGYAIEGDATSPHESLRMPRQEDASHLVRRLPTAADPLRLALEVTHPTHPVCLIYDALFQRAKLKRMLENATPLLMMQGTGKLQALVSMNATGRIMEKATAHLKAPPVRW